MNFKKFFFVIIFFLVLSYASNIKAVNVGDYINFNIDQSFDASARSQVTATLIKTTSNLYFYVEKSWWDSQVLAKKNEILADLDNLSDEFNNKIYPTLTSVFGSEFKPGVDGDNKITILFQSIKENLGGYFRSSDEYIKLQVPDSNEREMLYLPIAQIDNSQLKVFLAHEFVHLIAFNQKDRMEGVQEEIWLNEARSDYASTILGYDDSFEGSNLQRRVKDFLDEPNNSLTEWQDIKYDYAVENLFMHYLVDHYSISVLTDSLRSKLIGITSVNEVLLKNNYKKDFSQIFTDWTITMIINDCSLNSKYCYLNKNLKNLRINSTLNFLPLIGDSSLSVTNITKNWAGNWQKIIGGNGDLTLEFSSLAGLNFQVPYIIYDKDNTYTVKFLTLDSNEKGKITIKDFGVKYNALIIIPSLQTKISGFDGTELTYPYTFTVSITTNVSKEDPVLLQKLLDQIDFLKKQIAIIQAKNGGGIAHLPKVPSDNLCVALYNNLYFGLNDKKTNTGEVKCLQQFLKSQGSDIYPEGFITGNFGNLTKLAVVRFQEKYKNEILFPVGLGRGTGVVGALTRKKVNQLLQ